MAIGPDGRRCNAVRRGYYPQDFANCEKVQLLSTGLHVHANSIGAISHNLQYRCTALVLVIRLIIKIFLSLEKLFANHFELSYYKFWQNF